MSAKTVFISYRRDVVGKPFARALKDALTHQGYDAFLDVDGISAGRWAEQILIEVPRRAHFLLLLTPDALDRCTESDDWVRREFKQAVESGRNIVPVREESVDLAKMRASCHESVKALFGFQIASIRHGSFESDVDTLIARYIPPHKAPTPSAPTWNPRIDISQIVKYAPAELVGREGETNLLSESWDKAVRSEQGRPHVLTFVGLGGEGKTSLVAKWAADLAAHGWPGCDGAFAWSFYTQGTLQNAVSSDLFLAEALTFFGDATLAGSGQSAFDKGRRLAQLVGERRALLVLDGLEPLQYAPASPTPGELKDQGLAALLKGLAGSSRGLCVVTTRYALPDLRAFFGGTVREEKLTRLSRAAGVQLLRAHGVTGSDRRNLPLKSGDTHSEQVSEFEKLVEEVRGHALSLNLLGSFLHDAHAGDIRKRDLVKLEEADADEQGGHAFRVMDAYAQAFESGGEKGQRALAVLRLLGLFDRPATADCLNAMWRGGAIVGLSEPLIGLSEAQRNLCLQRLEDAKLLTVKRDTAGTLLSLDAHPLLREYFARRMRGQRPEAWRAAHRRLYEHLCATAREGDQPTLEDLQPLYQAVSHGCQAGLQQEALVEVYITRILRGPEAHSVSRLGAWGADLGAVACLFENAWNRPSPSLSEEQQSWLLGQTAIYLRAVGRLNEALQPMRTAEERFVRQENWRLAAGILSHLSELQLTLGEVAEALENAVQSVTYAGHTGDGSTRLKRLPTLAFVLHQAGRRPEAQARFREAEQMQAEIEPDHPFLYSLRGFQYCDLLLSEAERAAWRAVIQGVSPPERTDVEESTSPQERALVERELGTTFAALHAVADRAKQTLKWVTPQGRLLDMAQNQLTQGCAALYEAILAGTLGDLRAPAAWLDAALSGLRRAGQLDELPRGLLIRALLRSFTGALIGSDSAQSDLDEAWEIAERGPMRLFQADIHLHRARLFFRESEYPWESPQHDLAEARRLIFKHGYLRRRDELDDAEAALREFKR